MDEHNRLIRVNRKCTNNITYWTPLYCAVANVVTKIVQKILHIAVAKGWMKISALLIYNGTDPEAKDNDDNTPLHIAVAKESSEEIVSLLLSSGATVDAKGQYALTPLHIAVMKGNIHYVENLLNNGAYINASDLYGRTALHFTALSAEECVYYYHTKKNFNSKIRGQIANMLLCEGADVNARDITGLTTLHAAAYKGYPEIVEALLEYNANVNCKAKKWDQQVSGSICFTFVEDGFTPLHCSAYKGNKEIVTMLLNKGANVNAYQKDGTTALHIASKEFHKEVVKVLLEHGAKADSQCKRGITPLHVGILTGNLELIETMLKYGADINSRNVSDSTPLYIAARFYHYKAVSILLEYGADIHSIFEPLHEAIISMNYRRCERTAKALVRHIVSMKNANLYVSEEILSLSCDPAIKTYWAQCEDEIASMKSEKINNSSISFFNILAKTTHSLAVYMRNENIVQHLKSINYERKFPIYGGVIRSRFRKCMETRELLEQGIKIFDVIFKNLPELPYECKDEILRYLSEEELKNLIESFKHL